MAGRAIPKESGYAIAGRRQSRRAAARQNISNRAAIKEDGGRNAEVPEPSKGLEAYTRCTILGSRTEWNQTTVNLADAPAPVEARDACAGGAVLSAVGVGDGRTVDCVVCRVLDTGVREWVPESSRSTVADREVEDPNRIGNDVAVDLAGRASPYESGHAVAGHCQDRGAVAGQSIGDSTAVEEDGLRHTEVCEPGERLEADAGRRVLGAGAERNQTTVDLAYAPAPVEARNTHTSTTVLITVGVGDDRTVDCVVSRILDTGVCEWVPNGSGRAVTDSEIK